ncbi:MAG: CHAT domain-containing protein [Candidatus Lokiarchaeota archaeon]|nr:CHAT domain-containing protein [Candidatus Lokiarchaeota archaeon]MBD3199163.1 CHAT domain-containing protein [Candidatus Lokiarchaeota archaeon]
MSVKIVQKKEFLSKFQQRVIRGRELLQSGNHHWASKLFRELYFEIEKNEWLGEQKKHQLITIISNSWWLYLNSLSHQKLLGKEINYIKYIDAYKRFFSFLSKLEDFYLFNSFITKLLKSFIDMEDLSISGITKFINSFSAIVSERRDFLKLIELQILLMFLRNSVMPSDFFRTAMEDLGRVIYKLEPGKRALFLYVILENVSIKYDLMEDSEAFVKLMNKILVNRIPTYLKNEFSNISRISINKRIFPTLEEDLKELIRYLSNIGESNWIIIIIRNLFNNIKKFRSLGDAIQEIRSFIDFTIDRNQFEISFEIYDFLEDLFLLQSDLSYDNVLIELWIEACKRFVDMKEMKFLLQSLEKLRNHLKIPQKFPQIFHYFYTYNYLWKFKSMFFSLDPREFWKMMFYRTLFEEDNPQLAKKIIPFLDKKIQPLLNDLDSLYQSGEELKSQIYSFNLKEDIPIEEPSFEIENIILRISSEGKISYRIQLMGGVDTIEGTIKNEYWNDAQVIEIYNELFSNENIGEKYNFNLTEFGQFLYLLLPKQIRIFFNKIKVSSLNYSPQIYFILDQMTIPFDLIYDGNFFLLKYSIGYNIGEPPLRGICFQEEKLIQTEKLKKYKILIIDSINAISPKKWNEKKNSKDLLFPFPSGANELNYITNYFNHSPQVEEMEILTGSQSSKVHILEKIQKGSYNIIHIVGNIFYSQLNPHNSYFLTNDEQILKIIEIMNGLKTSINNVKPVIFFNTQIFDHNGIKIKDPLRSFGDIISYINLREIKGIIARNYAIFNDDTKEIISNFYTNLFNRESLGISLLKARQMCIANKTATRIEKKISSSSEEEMDTHIDIENSQAISSFMIYGEPWKKLS